MKEAFDLLAENLFPTTVHAGEAAGLESIKEAILIGRAQRLGHGVRVAEDIEIEFGAIDENGEELSDDTGLVSLGPVANWVRDRGIALEVCPSSNVHLGVYHEPSDVPLRQLVDAGATVALGADDPLLFLSRLTDQYELARTRLGFDDAELADLARASITASLAAEADKARWLAEVDAWIAN